MLLGALHLADHFLPDFGLRIAARDRFLTDGFGGAREHRACAPHRDSQIALPAKLWAGVTGELHAFVADGKTERIAAALFEIGALRKRGLGLRCLGLSFF
jgi:hypothetical protein